MAESPKQKACRLLASVSENERFSVINGPMLDNLFDLSQALKTMNKFQFKHHVSKEKNDFHMWINNSVKDPALAKSIKQARSMRELQQKVDSRIKELDKISREH